MYYISNLAFYPELIRPSTLLVARVAIFQSYQVRRKIKLKIYFRPIPLSENYCYLSDTLKNYNNFEKKIIIIIFIQSK